MSDELRDGEAWDDQLRDDQVRSDELLDNLYVRFRSLFPGSGAPVSEVSADRSGGQTGDAVRRLFFRLAQRYGEPGRRYHTLVHISEMLDHLDRYARDLDPDQRRVVELAVWFHDAVYAMPPAEGGPSNEERSAQLAELELPDVGVEADSVAAVARLVRMTEAHRVPTGDRLAGALSDADLAILAADPERYSEYTVAVRSEYSWVEESAWRQGRGSLLAGLLGRDHLFTSPACQRTLEDRARVNLSGELALLRS